MFSLVRRLARVTPQGEVLVPREVCRGAGLSPGQVVEVKVAGDAIVLKGRRNGHQER